MNDDRLQDIVLVIDDLGHTALSHAELVEAIHELSAARAKIALLKDANRALQQDLDATRTQLLVAIGEIETLMGVGS
jgi:adenine/guanine phosphoribosyltransferase-like PRPP-binding protein